MIARAWLWLRSVLFRARLERDMQEEMSAHLRRTAERLQAAGLSADDARTASRREFGNVAALMEEARDARGGRGIESVCADPRHQTGGSTADSGSDRTEARAQLDPSSRNFAHAWACIAEVA